MATLSGSDTWAFGTTGGSCTYDYSFSVSATRTRGTNKVTVKVTSGTLYCPSGENSSKWYIQISDGKKTTDQLLFDTDKAHNTKTFIDCTPSATFTVSASVKSKTFYFYLYAEDQQGRSGSNSVGSAVLSFNQGIGACVAPTIVTASGIIAPTSTFTVSWAGATSGTNNSIIGYDIYYLLSESGTVPTTANYTGTKQLVTTNTYGSITFDVTNVPRGYIITAGVVARGEQGADYYSTITTGGSVKINTLPEPPTVSPAATVVPSYGGTVQIDVIGGDTNDRGQKVSLYYSVGEETTKTVFTSPFEAEIKSTDTSKTYYFYTYDGCEYSTSVAQTITRNIKPQISAITGSADTYIALGGISTQRSGGDTEWAKGTSLNLTGTKTGTVTITPFIGILPQSGTISFSEGGYIYTRELTTASVAQEMPYCDIYRVYQNSSIDYSSNNLAWKLKIVLNDGIEDSDAWYFPSTATGQTTITQYATAKPSSVIDIYNQTNTATIRDIDVTGTKHGTMYFRAELKLYADTSMIDIRMSESAPTVQSVDRSQYAIKAYIIQNSKELEIQIDSYWSHTVKANGIYYQYISVLTEKSLPSEVPVIFKITLNDSTGQIVKKIVSSQSQMKETKAPTLNNFNYGADEIYPFTCSGTFIVSIGYPFGSYSLEEYAAEYNCSADLNQVISLRFTSNLPNVYKSSVGFAHNLTWEHKGDNLTTDVLKSQVYEFDTDSSFTYSYLGGQVKYYVNLQFTNLFGRTYLFPTWVTKTLNFDENPLALDITNIQWSKDNSATATWTNFNLGDKILGTGDKAVQGIYLKISTAFDIYTHGDVTVQVGLNSEAAFSEGQIYLVNKTFKYSEVQKGTGHNTPGHNSQTFICGPLSEISVGGWNNLILKVTGYHSTNALITKDIQLVRHVAPTFSLISCEYLRTDNSNYVLFYKYKVLDTGGPDFPAAGTTDNSMIYTLYADKASISPSLTQATSSAEVSGTVQLLSGKSDWGAKLIQLYVVSTVQGVIAHTLTAESNNIIVYYLQPTVSYRKSVLGINNSFPDSNATIDIQQATNKNLIIFRGLDNNGRAMRMEIDICNGTIAMYQADSLVRTLNLLTGKFTPEPVSTSEVSNGDNI